MVISQENLGVSNKIVEAFHMMWDNFPHTVLLLKKTREIVAVNKTARERGFYPCAKCFEAAGKTEIHAGCKANIALEENVAQRSINYNKDAKRVTDAYWLPVSTEDDLYLHFSVRIDLPIENQSR